MLYLHPPVNDKWKQALYNMPSYTSVGNLTPGQVRVSGDHVSIPAQEQQVQAIVDRFKDWLLKANTDYTGMVQREKQEAENAQRRQLQKAIEEEEQRQRILSKIRI